MEGLAGGSVFMPLLVCLFFHSAHFSSLCDYLLGFLSSSQLICMKEKKISSGMSNLAEIGINRSISLLLMLKNFSVLLFWPQVILCFIEIFAHEP